MAMKDSTKAVFNYVKEHDGEDFTAADIAEALGMKTTSVNGAITAAFARKDLMVRVPAEVEVTDEDGNVSHKTVKFIVLTDAGREFDPEATADNK